MWGIGSSSGACRWRRPACQPTDRVASVFPWKLGRRPITFQRSRLPALDPVLPDELDHALVRLRPARGEEHLVKIAGQDAGHQVGELLRGRCLEPHRVQIRQRGGLFPHRVDDLAGAVADAGHADPGRRVQVAPPVAVDQLDALAAHEHRGLRAQVRTDQVLGDGRAHRAPTADSNLSMITGQRSASRARSPGSSSVVSVPCSTTTLPSTMTESTSRPVIPRATVNTGS